MLQIGLQIWVAINLFIRFPLGIIVKVFKIENDIIDIADLIAFLASGFLFVGLCIGALVAGEVETGLGIACIILFGGILLFITGAFVYVHFKEKREKKREEIMKAQHQIVLEHLKEHGTISSSEAEKMYGIPRLRNRIIHLKFQGYNITEELRTKENQWGETYQELVYVLSPDGIQERKNNN